MVVNYKKASNIVFHIVVSLVLLVIALTCLLPVWHVFMSAFTEPLALLEVEGFMLWPTKFSTEGFDIIFSHNLLWRSYLNTVIYTVCSTCLCVLLSVIGGYVLSRKNVLLKKPLLVFILITMFFNGGQIPFYTVVRSLGLANSMAGMILPTCVNALSIVMVKNGMDSLPDVIAEAARIDGAGHFRTMVKIVVPLTTSHIAVVALFSVVGQWNSWVNAAMFLTTEFSHLYPLQMVMRDILIKNNATGVITPSGLPVNFYLPSLQATMVVVGSLPLILLYPFMQKYFEKGIVLGGVKG